MSLLLYIVIGIVWGAFNAVGTRVQGYGVAIRFFSFVVHGAIWPLSVVFQAVALIFILIFT